jgi:hypothetical protein
MWRIAGDVIRDFILVLLILLGFIFIIFIGPAKFLRIVLIVCVAVVAVPVVLGGLLLLRSWVQVESFYFSKPLLREMRAVEPDTSFDSAPAREVLLQRLPPDREAAVAMLRGERFDCSNGIRSAIPARMRARPKVVICYLDAPGVFSSYRWHVGFEIDDDQHVSEAGVAIFAVRFPATLW